MTEIKQETTIGVKAVDGTKFFFNGDEERAKAECKKYEESAIGVVVNRLKDILIDSQNTIKIENGKTKEDGTPETENFSCYIDEDVARMFGYYEYKSYIFVPKTKEDIDNLQMYCTLKGCGYIHNIDKIEPGKMYMVAMDTDGECTLCVTFEEAVESVKKQIAAQFAKMEAYLNPEAYIRESYNKYVKKEAK